MEGEEAFAPDTFFYLHAAPALYLRLLPTFASIPLLRLRCQGSALPTHQVLSPTTRRHLPYQLRLCHHHCPFNTLGDELHMRTPVIPALSGSHLLADYALIRAALTPLQQVSFLLASDPRHHLAGQDRDQSRAAVWWRFGVHVGAVLKMTFTSRAVEIS